METLSALMCLSRRSTFFVFFFCIMFFACAFYSVFVDFDGATLSYKLADDDAPDTQNEFGENSPPVHNSRLENEAGAKPRALVDHNSMLRNEAGAKAVAGDSSRTPPSEMAAMLPSAVVHSSTTLRSKVSTPSGMAAMHPPPVVHSSTTLRIENVANPDSPVGLESSNSSNRPNILNPRAERVNVKTKYIHLLNTSSSASVSTSTSASVSEDSNHDTCHHSMKDSKLILLWTPFFQYWDYLPKSHFSQCSKCRNCRVTRDKSKLLESDAVIFHARDMSVVDMPPVHPPHQRWVFYCLESPPYSDFPGLLYTQNMFNWTMTYRADSDILATYGTVSKVRPPRKLDLQSLEWSWSNKTRSVAWLSSHCRTHGGRDAYARELQKHIDIDVYGSCGTAVCPLGETEQCYQDFGRKYKFFLAFENTICKDYITEKFYRTLKYNIIPVVFGGADYKRFAPPGSYIDALSFKSPRHLAFFLAGVGKNKKLYSSYFKWRRHYSVDLSNTKECQLCSMLHRKDLKPSSYYNLRDWWVHGSRCRVWNPKR